MRLKSLKTSRKPAQNNALSPLSPERTAVRFKEPDYVIVLRRFGFLRPGDLRDSWGLWQTLVADHVVAAMSARIEAKRAFLSRSAASANKDAKQVLGAMTPAQRAALKLRLGISQ